MAQCLKIKSIGWQQERDEGVGQQVVMKNGALYCHPMAKIIYIEANYPNGYTRMFRISTNQITEDSTDIQVDGDNITIYFETAGEQDF